jgi:protein-S-isoprenylcysteine O-methyltransferase Ste14
LGAYFSPYIEIRERQPLIQQGPFRYLRHPNYTGLLLEGFGLPLTFAASPVLLFAAFVFLPVILIRIRLEERALVEKFGLAYLEYRRDVGAIIPYRRAGGMRDAG